MTALDLRLGFVIENNFSTTARLMEQLALSIYAKLSPSPAIAGSG